jgi:hypothetical protein
MHQGKAFLVSLVERKDWQLQEQLSYKGRAETNHKLILE